MSLLFLLDAITENVNILKCPIYHFIGIPCPFCGMTRAAYSMMSLDFKSSLYYNPCFVFVILGIIIYVIYGVTKNTMKLFYFIIGVATLFYIVRMFLYFPHHDVINIKQPSLVAFLINSMS